MFDFDFRVGKTSLMNQYPSENWLLTMILICVLSMWSWNSRLTSFSLPLYWCHPKFVCPLFQFLSCCFVKLLTWWEVWIICLFFNLRLIFFSFLLFLQFGFMLFDHFFLFFSYVSNMLFIEILTLWKSMLRNHYRWTGIWIIN